MVDGHDKVEPMSSVGGIPPLNEIRKQNFSIDATAASGLISLVSSEMFSDDNCHTSGVLVPDTCSPTSDDLADTTPSETEYDDYSRTGALRKRQRREEKASKRPRVKGRT